MSRFFAASINSWMRMIAASCSAITLRNFCASSSGAFAMFLSQYQMK